MKRVILVLVSGLTLFAISCETPLSPIDPKEPADSSERLTYVAPTSPDAVLRNFVVAYEGLDLDGYAACLHPDFRFIPNPRDRLGFEYLTREEDLRSTSNMFAEVSFITLELTYETDQPSDDVEFPARDGYRQIEAVAHLRVGMTGGPGDAPVVMRVPGHGARFTFAVDEGQSPPTYRIIRQRDLGSRP